MLRASVQDLEQQRREQARTLMARCGDSPP
jgi:hypothetical protein